MKKVRLLKSFVVIGLSIILLINLATVVFGADSNTYSEWDAPTTLDSNSTNNASVIDTNSTTNSSISDWNVVGTNNTTANTTNVVEVEPLNIYENAENTNSNVNSLAYTGVESNSILAVLLIGGVAVAIYSFKKVKEYNNL